MRRSPLHRLLVWLTVLAVSVQALAGDHMASLCLGCESSGLSIRGETGCVDACCGESAPKEQAPAEENCVCVDLVVLASHAPAKYQELVDLTASTFAMLPPPVAVACVPEPSITDLPIIASAPGFPPWVVRSTVLLI